MTRTQTSRRFDKAGFFRDVGYEPHEGQRKVHESSALRRVLACGVRWGKSRCAAMEALSAAMEPRERSMGWVAAPTYDLADKVFREIALIALQHLQHRVVSIKESERRIVLHNVAGGLSEIRAKSADNPVSLLGEGLHWLIVDEASRLKPAIWESHLSQRLIDYHGWALLISTPRGKGWFYEMYRRGQSDQFPDVASWNSPSWENPYLDRKLIEAEKAKLPERVFLQEYGARFVEGSGSVFQNVRECATGEWRKPVQGQIYYAGLDLAKVEDYTVLILMDGQGRVVHVTRFRRLDWSLQLARIEAVIERFGMVVLYCDSTGVGDPIHESLWKRGAYAIPYTLTSRSKNDLINNLAQVIELGAIELPRPEIWPEGIDELEAYEYSVTDAGNVRSGAPSGAHDDAVMAAALAGYAWRFHRIQLRPHTPPRLAPA